jgi:hypothetical protein|tara:strand:- start:12643 stop:13896 length:1254 start_codon:yes stop_codon:yes gene_type:complete
MTKKINNILVDTSNLPSSIVSRRLIVNGERGAKFILQVISNSTSSSVMTKYYDFQSNAFTSGHIGSSNNLAVTMSSKKYATNIVFPSDDTFTEYTIKLIASEGTEIANSNNKKIINKIIEKQTANATLTFQAESLANPNNYQTTPTTTSSGALTDTGSVSFDWTITNASTDAGGFGLVLNSGYKTLNHKALYIKTTTDVDGEISSSTTVTVTSLTSIAVGSYLWSGTGLSGTPRINAIDTENKILTLSSAQTINHGVTLTVKSYGKQIIQDIIGVSLDFTPVSGGIGNSPRFVETALTKTVRGAVSGSTNITLTDTHGIAGGEIVTYTGLGVDNSATNRVTVVTPDCPDLADSSSLDNDGVAAVELAQTLEAGTVLTFFGSHKTLQILGGISINGYPSTNQTIYFDLDVPLSVGANT